VIASSSHVVPSCDSFHRPVMVLPSSLNVPVNRCEKPGASRENKDVPAPNLDRQRRRGGLLAQQPEEDGCGRGGA
jgi:hypothetical protein